MDSPHNNFNPDEHGRDDKTLPDGAGTPPPPSDDLSHDMLARNSKRSTICSTIPP